MENKVVAIASVWVVILGASHALAAGPEAPAARPQVAQSGSSESMGQQGAGGSQPGVDARPGGGASAPDAMPRERSEPGAPAGDRETRETAASSLEGKALVGPAGEKVGQIEKVAGDKMIVSVGGFLGIGAKRVLVPQEEVDIARTGEGVQAVTSLTEEALKAMPEYTAEDEGSRAGNGVGAVRN